MSSNQQSLTIDPRLLGIFKIIWSGKWKIILITIVITLISVYYGSQRPDSYNISILIKKSPPSAFNKYKTINDILIREGYSIKIDPETLIEKFILEFNRLNVLNELLKKNPYLEKHLAGLDDASKQKALLEIVRSFTLSNTKNNENVLVFFKWHDPNEGLKLLDSTIKAALVNVKKSIINEIEEKIKTVNLIDENKLKELDSKKKSIIYFKIKNLQRDLVDLEESLEVVKRKEIKQVEKRILFLKEQSNIARHLDIKNGIGYKDTTQSGGYYLRGYEAIDKEIDLIKNSSIDQNILSVISFNGTSRSSYTIETQIEILKKRIEKTKDLQFNQYSNSRDLLINNVIEKLIDEHTIKPSYEYIKLQREINEIKNNSLPVILNDYLETIDKSGYKSWISYNQLSAKIISLNIGFKKMLAFGVIFGLLVGILFVLVSNIGRLFLINKTK
ncbi:MAG: hypothetical protein CMI75_07190 [Candidatus Pelagibacter sp.]|nr:hypothetical protein [Candidatus Pelagibacter sp.]